MTITIPRGHSDPIIEQIKTESLARYQADHPGAEIALYRQNSVSVRVRIVDPDFSRLNKPERSKQVWAYLEALSEDVQGDISTLLLLTPEEARMSFANFEFDDPVPSEL